MNIYGATRVSTAEQAADGKTSLETQRRVIRGVVMQHDNWPEPIFFEDIGVSGSIPFRERPEGSKLFEQLQPGDILIVAKMDRLFRSASDALNTVEHFQKIHVKLIIADMGSEPVTENGTAKMWFTMLAAFAEFERTRIAERVRDGKREKTANGGHSGGAVPYGYSVEGRGRTAKLVANTEEMEVIARCKELHARGLTLRGIIRRLTIEGQRSRNGKPFAATQVMRMVKGGASA